MSVNRRIITLITLAAFCAVMAIATTAVGTSTTLCEAYPPQQCDTTSTTTTTTTVPTTTTPSTTGDLANTGNEVTALIIIGFWALAMGLMLRVLSRSKEDDDR